MFRIHEYITKAGQTPFGDWFSKLDSAAALKVNTYLTRIEQGNFSCLKPLKGAFGEVVIDWGPGYRVYAGKANNELILLLGGGTKKRQQKDIQKALGYWKEYKKVSKDISHGDYETF